MKTTFKVLFFLKRSVIKKNGKAPIITRITINGNVAEFNTKLETEPTNWNTELGKVSGKSNEANNLNYILEDIKSKLNKIYHDLQKTDSVVTPEKVKNDFLGVSEKHEMLLKLFERHNGDVKKLIGNGKSPATYQKYEVTRKHLATFIKRKYSLSDIPLKDINNLFINDFEVYLRTIGKCNSNTTAKFIQFFKRIVIIARNNGWIVHDPFANYKIVLSQVDRDYLTEEELQRIIDKEFSMPRLAQVRDIFVFACLTGLAYIDVKSLTIEKIRKSFDKKDWVMTKRVKTGVIANIPLLSGALKILEKYKGLPNGAVLPVLSNQKMNSYLKEIADLCGINKNVSFHVARHTFATTVTLANGVSIESVSKMLGHKNIQTTQIYARITDSKVGNDMSILAEKLQFNL